MNTPEKILILDLDGTMTTHSSLAALTIAMGVTPAQYKSPYHSCAHPPFCYL